LGRRKNMVLIIGIVLTIFSSSFFAACSSPAATEDANKTPEVAVSQLSDKVNKYNLSEAEKKMSTDLLNLIKATESQSSSEPACISNGFQSSNFVSADPDKGITQDLIYVYVYLNEDSNIEAIQPFVQEITERDEENVVAVAWISVDKLEELASQEEVRNIRTVLPPVVNVGSVTTQGDAIHGTSIVRDNYDQDGSGIIIGVISNGVDHLADSQASGNLPADVTVLSNKVGGDEGTAMLEIIHDMTPGAKLYFHDCGDNIIAFNSAIDKLVASGCNIIVDDIGWPDEPYFEDGIIASHVADVINSTDVLFVSAAGNDADCHYQETYINNGQNLHNKVFPIHLKPDDYVDIYLQWNDPFGYNSSFGYSSNDYDLYLSDQNGAIVGSSEQIQNGTQSSCPFERINGTYDGPEDDLYITISNYEGNAEPKILELFIYTTGTIKSPDLSAQDSIYGHPAVLDVVAVGAISAFDENYDEIESYSSQGPVTITYPAASQRQKPDICGVDDVNITGAGNFGEPYNNNWYFSGTSAAAPHVAAVAAQIWGSTPSMTASEVRSILLSNAVDERGVVGYDTVYGYGIANSSKYFMGIATAKDKGELIAAIKVANAKVGAAVAGAEDGQYPQAAIDAFKVAITTSRAVADDTNATYAEVNRAVTDLKEAEAIFDAAKIVTVDVTPPASVTNLMESDVGSSWIRWQWANPKDVDFKHVMIYLDDVFVTNISDSYYNATGLADGIKYNIGIETVDVSGNSNSLRVSDSATTLKLPQVSGFSGKDITTTSITLVWETSGETAKVELYRNNVIIGNLSGTTTYVDSGLAGDTTYSYTLIPYNKDGMAGKDVSVSLKTKSNTSNDTGEASSWGSSRKKSTISGGGGGGAPTGDRYENVLLKEVQNIFVTKDKHITYSFKKEGNKITSIQFLSLKNSGNIQATIKMLKDKSSFAKSKAPGQIYQQMNIWVGKVGFVVPENVNDLRVDFKVEKKWLEENNIETDTVKLYRYADSSWNALPTTITGEDESCIYFESQTPGFSPFAIISETEAPEVTGSVMKSVNEEATAMVPIEDAYPADKNTVKSKLNVFPVVVYVIAILLAGAYIVYRKRG